MAHHGSKFWIEMIEMIRRNCRCTLQPFQLEVLRSSIDLQIFKDRGAEMLRGHHEAEFGKPKKLGQKRWYHVFFLAISVKIACLLGGKPRWQLILVDIVLRSRCFMTFLSDHLWLGENLQMWEFCQAAVWTALAASSLWTTKTGVRGKARSKVVDTAKEWCWSQGKCRSYCGSNAKDRHNCWKSPDSVDWNPTKRSVGFDAGLNVKSSPGAGICDEYIKTISQNIQSLLYKCYSQSHVTIHCAHLRTINLYTQISIYTYTYTIHIYICVLNYGCLCVYRVYSIHINLYILCLTSIFASLGIWFPATRGEVPSWWAKAQRASRRGCWGCSRWRWKGWYIN